MSSPFFVHLIAAVGLLLPAVAQVEEPIHPVRPLLWKVEGMGLEKPSWLFGTIHLGEGPVSRLHPSAAKALGSSDVVYTELSMDPASQLGLAKHFVRDDGKTLSESIGEELSKQLDTELKVVQEELTSAPFQSFKTWAVAVTVPMLQAQLGGSTPLDTGIWNTAVEAGKTTRALEKPDDQFRIFDDLTEEEQIILLSESLRLQREARENNENPLDLLINAYVSGEPKKVEAAMEHHLTGMAEGEHKELGDKLLKRMLDDRNVGICGTIVENLTAEPSESHFFAVGAGHYVGKNNIGEMLAKKGFTVTLVTP